MMNRTASRPLVTGTVSTRAAVTFGVVLAVVSTLVLGVFVNWLSALLALGAFGFYVGIFLWRLGAGFADDWGSSVRLPLLCAVWIVANRVVVRRGSIHA